MIEAQAQVVLLVRAFEEADRDGVLLTAYDRAAATRRALRVTGLANWPQDLADAESARYGETVARRARVLFEALRRRIPALGGMIRLTRFGVTTGPILIVLAFLAGLAPYLLGPGQAFHPLSLTLLGILCWNLGIYAIALAAPFSTRARQLRRFVPWLAERLLRGAVWRRIHGWGVAAAGPREWESVTASAIMRFAGMWLRLAGRLLAARLRRTLHFAAAALAAGAVVGMYVRGIGLGYPVAWNGAWLGERILAIGLWPASALSGIDIPALGAADPTPWIQLHALAAMLYVVLPRTVLAFVECWRCHVRVLIPIDLRETYYRRVFTEWRGATRRIDIVSYGYAPSAATLAALKALLHDHFGARAEIRAPAPLACGDDASCVAGLRRSPRGPWAPAATSVADMADPERETCHVVLFNTSQTPEPEVHGKFLTDLMALLEPRDGRLLVVLDGSVYRERVPDPELHHERRLAWQRVARDAGVAAIEPDPRRPVDDEVIAELGAAIWRRPETKPAADRELASASRAS